MQTPSLCQCRIAGTLEMCGLWLGCYFFKLILSFRKIDNLNFNVERWRRAVLKFICDVECLFFRIQCQCHFKMILQCCSPVSLSWQFYTFHALALFYPFDVVLPQGDMSPTIT